MAAAVAVAQTYAFNQGPIAASQSRALSDMRAFLSRQNPQSPSEALRLLRNAFPDSSLSMRVTACGLSNAA